jgi:hypothetical protein
MNIIEFIKAPELINGDLSPYQETALRLLYGLPLNLEQRGIAEAMLSREITTQREYSEASFICGRRGGKSDKVAANTGVYEATTGGHERFLAPGERGHIVLIAQDMRAARVDYRYILAKLENSPLLSQLIQEVRKEEIGLKNRITISIFPCSFRATRGFSIPVAILDELAFFRVEGVNVDKEIVDAIRPAMATFPRAKLIKISSPYAKAGELYRDYVTRGNRPELLCLQAASWEMNPSIPQTFLDAERERDPEMFDREYGAKFTDTISSAFTREAVEACVIAGRFELPYREGCCYRVGVDPSGGGQDEFTLSIGHRENERIVQDCLRGYKATKPKDVVGELAAVLKSYHVSTVVGDKYAGQWVADAFRECGISYHFAERTASEAFLELLPLINQGGIELLDDKKQSAQLISLERRKGRTGKDSVGHPQGGHDDRANALALAACELRVERKPAFFTFSLPSDPVKPENIFNQSLQLQKKGGFYPWSW